MISVTDFIEYEEVRAVLGLSSFELPDETLDLPMFQRALSKALRGITGTYNATSMSVLGMYDFLAAKTVTTEDEDATLEDISQFALYTVAAACLTGINLMALKAITDGKSSDSRFNYDKIFRELEAKIYGELAKVTAAVRERLGLATSGYASMLEIVPPIDDRVTG